MYLPEPLAAEPEIPVATVTSPVVPEAIVTPVVLSYVWVCVSEPALADPLEPVATVAPPPLEATEPVATVTAVAPVAEAEPLLETVCVCSLGAAVPAPVPEALPFEATAVKNGILLPLVVLAVPLVAASYATKLPEPPLTPVTNVFVPVNSPPEKFGYPVTAAIALPLLAPVLTADPVKEALFGGVVPALKLSIY